MNSFLKKKTIESINISIFLFKKTSERIRISIFLFDRDKLQFLCPRLRVLVTEFPSPKSHFSIWWIQLTPTKDRFPLHGVDKALQWALGTASGYWWKFASFLYNFYYWRNLCYRKFRRIRFVAFYKSRVLKKIVKFTGK